MLNIEYTLILRSTCQLSIIKARVMSGNSRPAGGVAEAGRKAVDWDLHVETGLVRSDWEASLRGAHLPRPLTAPIFAASTYRLANASEGEELANSLAKVALKRLPSPLIASLYRVHIGWLPVQPVGESYGGCCSQRDNPTGGSARNAAFLLWNGSHIHHSLYLPQSRRPCCMLPLYIPHSLLPPLRYLCRLSVVHATEG